MAGNPNLNPNRVDASEEITTPALEAGKQFTIPSGVRLNKNTQTISSDTATEVSWDFASERNSLADEFADLSNNAIIIPNSDYSVARVGVSLRIDSHPPTFMSVLKNGSQPEGAAIANWSGNHEFNISGAIWSDWIAVDEGDSFTVRFGQATGEDQDIREDVATWFALEAY